MILDRTLTDSIYIYTCKYIYPIVYRLEHGCESIEGRVVLTRWYLGWLRGKCWGQTRAPKTTSFGIWYMVEGIWYTVHSISYTVDDSHIAYGMSYRSI